MPLSNVLGRLQDTSAQIRVRGAMFLLLLLVLAAQEFGLGAAMALLLTVFILVFTIAQLALTRDRT